tara:strand:- start:226 stop:363 length:138 start_codon:yes stop_codon:yes gene_type:complete
MKIINVKNLPFDIFQEMLKDHTLSNKVKNQLIINRGDQRYKLNRN